MKQVEPVEQDDSVRFLNDEQFAENQGESAAMNAYFAEAREQLNQGKSLDEVIANLSETMKGIEEYGEIIPEEEAGFEVSEENSDEA